MRRIVFIVIACALSAQARADQVYKCTENGKTVYSSQQCSPGAKPIAAQPATGSYNAAAASEARMRTMQAQSELATAEAERESARQRQRAAAESASSSANGGCSQMKTDHAEAQYWANNYRHPENIRREKAKAKYLEDKSFFDCPNNNRISLTPGQ